MCFRVDEVSTERGNRREGRKSAMRGNACVSGAIVARWRGYSADRRRLARSVRGGCQAQSVAQCRLCGGRTARAAARARRRRVPRGTRRGASRPGRSRSGRTRGVAVDGQASCDQRASAGRRARARCSQSALARPQPEPSRVRPVLRFHLGSGPRTAWIARSARRTAHRERGGAASVGDASHGGRDARPAQQRVPRGTRRAASTATRPTGDAAREDSDLAAAAARRRESRSRCARPASAHLSIPRTKKSEKRGMRSRRQACGEVRKACELRACRGPRPRRRAGHTPQQLSTSTSRSRRRCGRASALHPPSSPRHLPARASPPPTRAVAAPARSTAPATRAAPPRAASRPRTPSRDRA